MLIPLYLLALLLLQTSKSSPSESGRGFVGQLIENKHGKVFLLRNTNEYKEDQEKKQEEKRRKMKTVAKMITKWKLICQICGAYIV